MPIYSCIYATSTATVFNAKKDTKELDRLLEALQEAGARIVDVKVTVGGSGRSLVQAVYLILYEAETKLCKY